jgi:hypothetical protein
MSVSGVAQKTSLFQSLRFLCSGPHRSRFVKRRRCLGVKIVNVGQGLGWLRHRSLLRLVLECRNRKLPLASSKDGIMNRARASLWSILLNFEKLIEHSGGIRTRNGRPALEFSKLAFFSVTERIGGALRSQPVGAGGSSSAVQHLMA